MKRTTAVSRWQPTGLLMVDDASDSAIGSEGITIACYENYVPLFIAAEMERLYENIFSSVAQFRVYGGKAKHTSTYIVRKCHKIITAFLFQKENGKVQVCNEVIKVNDDDVNRFANYIFARYNDVTVVSFRAVHADICKLSFPYQRFNYSEDIVVTLPATEQEYLSSLGKNTRRNVKRYTDKLMRKFPSFNFSVHVKGDVEERNIADIIRLHRARMTEKQKVSAIDDEEVSRMISLVKEYGLVGVATIDGRVCAGAICFRVGANYFMSVIAHDPEHDDCWIGVLCSYMTICECIARGGKEFHFLWGQYPYKYTLLGVQRDLDHLDVYRSYPYLLLNGGMALRAVYRGYIRQAHLWLHRVENDDSFISQLAIKCLRHLGRLKRFGIELLAANR